MMDENDKKITCIKEPPTNNNRRIKVKGLIKPLNKILEKSFKKFGLPPITSAWKKKN